MKNKDTNGISFRLIAIIALAAVIGFSMAACKTEDDGGGPTSKTYKWANGSDNYELQITSPSGGALAVLPLDATYVLKINTVTKSSGKASGDPEVKLTLTPSTGSGTIELKITTSGNTITVTVTKSDIPGVEVKDGSGTTTGGSGNTGSSSIDGIWMKEYLMGYFIVEINGSSYTIQNYEKGNFSSTATTLTFSKTHKWVGNWATDSGTPETFNYNLSNSNNTITMSGGTGESTAFNGKWSRAYFSAYTIYTNSDFKDKTGIEPNNTLQTSGDAGWNFATCMEKYDDLEAVRDHKLGISDKYIPYDFIEEGITDFPASILTNDDKEKYLAELNSKGFIIAVKKIPFGVTGGDGITDFASYNGGTFCIGMVTVRQELIPPEMR